MLMYRSTGKKITGSIAATSCISDIVDFVRNRIKEMLIAPGKTKSGQPSHVSYSTWELQNVVVKQNENIIDLTEQIADYNLKVPFLICKYH